MLLFDQTLSTNSHSEMDGVESKKLSNESWIIRESLSLLKEDIYTGKAWLITARSLFPRSFDIQLEIYQLEKSMKNAEKAAGLLKEMMVNFPRETVLWEEITQMTEALQAEILDEKAKFYKEVFDSLPAQHQCGILLQLVETQHDVLSKCKLMVLVLRRHPETIPQHGVNLIESLIASEEQAQMPSAVNCYRKYLVCDILPQVLRSASVELSQVQVLRWLQKAIQFYVCYVTHSHTPTDSQEESPTPRRQSVSARRNSIQGLPEKEGHISDPWQSLLDIVNMASNHLHWNTTDLFEKKSRESQWQHVYNLLSKARMSEGSVRNTQMAEVFYCTLLLCFDCILGYCAKMDPHSFAGGSTQPLVLIEGFRTITHNSPDHKAKKLKTDQGVPQLHANPTLTGSKELIENMKIAVKCWELLHSSDDLLRELESLLAEWRADHWPWFSVFLVDHGLFQGNLKDAIARLTRQSPAESHTHAQIRSGLQLACCYYRTANYTKCCETVLGLIQHIDEADEASTEASTEATADSPVMSTAPGRHLYIMPCNAQQVLPYCIHLLITCLKEKTFKTFSEDDLSLGHMLVLLQYDWPKYDHVFFDVLHRIKRRGSFKYNLFFNYIINIDILEEFAFLRSNEGGKLNLDILPISSSVMAQSRTVTRGVNKGVKEDFKSALEKQITRCNENVQSLIRLFLVQERTVLQQSLV